MSNHHDLQCCHHHIVMNLFLIHHHKLSSMSHSERVMYTHYMYNFINKFIFDMLTNNHHDLLYYHRHIASYQQLSNPHIESSMFH